MHPPQFANLRFAAICLVHLALPCAALAVRPAELIDANLNRLPVRVVSLTGQDLRAFDAERRLATLNTGEYLGLRFTPDPEAAAAPAPAPARHLLRLADGQVIAGQPAGIDESGRVKWNADALGQIVVELDDVASFSVDDAAMTRAPLPPPANDTIELTNGDRLVGFVEKLAPDQLTLTVDGNALPLAWDRIARVTLANPIRPALGDWVALTDGSRLSVTDLRLDSERLTATAMNQTKLALAADRVRAVDFATARRMVPLGAFPATVTAGGLVFGVPMPPEFDGEAGSLHAPVTVEFEAPRGATRFAASLSVAKENLDWADMELIVADGRGELARVTLNRQNPAARVNVQLRDRRLILRVDPARHGPIRDRLALADAVVLIESDAE